MPARRAGQVDDYHGELVADPYRWLEDTNAVETRAWIDAENELTEEWLSQVKGGRGSAGAFRSCGTTRGSGRPSSGAGGGFQLSNSGLQNQDVLYVIEGAEDEGRVLLDPQRAVSRRYVAVPSFDVTAHGRFPVHRYEGRVGMHDLSLPPRWRPAGTARTWLSGPSTPAHPG